MIIENVYSTMNIKANFNVGGLIGNVYSDTSLNNTYAIGKVEGKSSSSIGGLVGRFFDEKNIITNRSYWIIETTSQTTSALGTSQTISALVKQSSYGGWNFTSIWEIEEGKSFAYLKGMEVPEVFYEIVKDYPIMEGQGTQNNPHIITNIKQLEKVQKEMLSHYKLGVDIDLSSISNWTPIGTEKEPFKGSLDGNGYKISNMKINSKTNYKGLFGYTDGSSIKNLKLENYTIIGSGNYIGGLVGYNKGWITNVSTNGEIILTGTSSYIGGLVGYCTVSTQRGYNIEKNCTSGNINGNSDYGTYVGGLMRRYTW